MTTMSEPVLLRTIEFVEPLPGFESEDSYSLSPIDSHGVLFSLRSLRTPALRFVLTPAACFFADYVPTLNPVVTRALGDDADGNVELMLILTIGSGLADATANLRAPVLVSTDTGRAMQVVLEDETLPMRRPLLPRAS